MGLPLVEYGTLIGAFGVGAILPGADFALVLRQSVGRGRRAGLMTAAGIATAILVHGAYTLLGVGVIVASSLVVFDALKLVAAGYVLWLGIEAWRAPAPRPPGDLGEAGSGERIGDGRAFTMGFLTNLTNPKAMLFFVALFTSLVGAGTPLVTRAFYVGSMSVELFAWFALVSVFFTTTKVRRGFYKLGRWFNRITAATFILLAARVALAVRG